MLSSLFASRACAASVLGCGVHSLSRPGEALQATRDEREVTQNSFSILMVPLSFCVLDLGAEHSARKGPLPHRWNVSGFPRPPCRLPLPGPPPPLTPRLRYPMVVWEGEAQKGGFGGGTLATAPPSLASPPLATASPPLRWGEVLPRWRTDREGRSLGFATPFFRSTKCDTVRAMPDFDIHALDSLEPGHDKADKAFDRYRRALVDACCASPEGQTYVAKHTRGRNVDEQYPSS